MTVFAHTFHSFQGPYTDCLQTPNRRLADSTQILYIFCAYFIFPVALFIFAVFILSLIVWIVTAAALVFLLWFQCKLSLILAFLGQDDLEFVAPRRLAVVLYAGLVIVSIFGQVSLIFVDM